MYDKKHITSVPAQTSRGAEPTPAVGAGMSNSALTALLLHGRERSGILNSELAARFNAQQAGSALERQIPAAENEADRLSAGVGPGSSPEAVKAAMGEQLDADFSGVRFHTDTGAAGKADAMGARAYTSGQDVYFGSGGFDPTIAAHELVHTVQQGAVDGGVQTVSAPAMSAQMWPWSKKKPQSSIPSRLSFAKRDNKKKGTNGVEASVVGVQGAGEESGQSAVVKMGADIVMERAMADFFNEAGRTFEEKNPTKWRFRAPDARALTEDEKNEVMPLVRDKKLGSLQNNSDPVKEAEHAVAFSVAPGSSREEGDANPGSGKERSDYQRMMGYISFMDTLIGNNDRLVGKLNRGNWLEDRKNRQVTLIDNDIDGGNSSLREGMDARKDWLTELVGRTDPHPGEKTKVTNEGYNKSAAFLRGLTGDVGAGPSREVADILGYDGQNTDAYTGIKQAVADLPGLRDRLKQKFYASNVAAGGDGKFNEYQSELLERMLITHEFMTDPKMAAIYRELEGIGFATPHKRTTNGMLTDELVEESDETKQRRAQLLAMRDQLRYGGQTGGARPTATSGPGWTRGTAQDWLKAGQPAAPAPAPAAPTAGAHRRRRKPLDTSLD